MWSVPECFSLVGFLIFFPGDRIASIILRTFRVSSLSQFHKYMWVHKPFKRPSFSLKRRKIFNTWWKWKIRAVCVCNVRFMGATGTPGNVEWSSWCYSCLMVQAETLGPSEHQRFHLCGNIPQEKSTLHSTSRSCANLGPDWDVSLQRSSKSR